MEYIEKRKMPNITPGVKVPSGVFCMDILGKQGVPWGEYSGEHKKQDDFVIKKRLYKDNIIWVPGTCSCLKIDCFKRARTITVN